jgi:hypothetical protein
MANPTTNYGFVLPTATDLVTDLPADFDVALQGVDTRLKALQPGTTLGDLAYSSSTANTNTRLPIGTSGQILTVSGGVPAWTTPGGGGGLTLLSTTSVSGSGTVTVSSISQSYKNLYIYLKDFYATTNSIVNFYLNSTGQRYNYVNNDGGVNTANGGGYTTIRQGTNLYNGTGGYGDGSVSNNATLIIYDYSRTSSMKNFQWFGGGIQGPDTTWTSWHGGGVYMGNSAISSISTYMSSNFSAGTLYIYGEN